MYVMYETAPLYSRNFIFNTVLFFSAAPTDPAHYAVLVRVPFYPTVHFRTGVSVQPRSCSPGPSQHQAETTAATHRPQPADCGRCGECNHLSAEL